MKRIRSWGTIGRGKGLIKQDLEAIEIKVANLESETMEANGRDDSNGTPQQKTVRDDDKILIQRDAAVDRRGRR
jgi:hypothetical protein